MAPVSISTAPLHDLEPSEVRCTAETTVEPATEPASARPDTQTSCGDGVSDIASLIDSALKLKDRGNTELKAGNFSQAQTAYNQAMESLRSAANIIKDLLTLNAGVPNPIETHHNRIASATKPRKTTRTLDTHSSDDDSCVSAPCTPNGEVSLIRLGRQTNQIPEPIRPPLEPMVVQRVSAYQRDIDNYRTSILLNQALVELKVSRPHFAIQICNQILGFKPGNVKALFRRGQARSQISMLDEAIEDFEKILAVDPGNQEVRKELVNARHAKRGKDDEGDNRSGRFRSNKASSSGAAGAWSSSTGPQILPPMLSNMWNALTHNPIVSDITDSLKDASQTVTDLFKDAAVIAKPRLQEIFPDSVGNWLEACAGERGNKKWVELTQKRDV